MTQWIIPVCAAILLMATCTMHRVARADNNPFSGARSFEITMKRTPVEKRTLQQKRGFGVKSQHHLVRVE